MFVMRYTAVDSDGTVSFVADCHALSALVAACAGNPRTIEQLLARAEQYHRSLRDYVSSGLAIFDEHNVDGRYAWMHAALSFCKPHELPVFRVVDEATREASLQPAKAGIVLFNLSNKRIVQIHNTYADVQRTGRIRVHDGSTLTREVHRYQLPIDWAVVP